MTWSLLELLVAAKNCGSEKNFGAENFFGSIKNFRFEKNVGSEKISCLKNVFRSRRSLTKVDQTGLHCTLFGHI